MKAPREFTTARLRFAAPTAADAEPMYERYASDPAVTRFLSWPRHQCVADTRVFVAFSDSEWERRPAGPYLIRSRDDGRLLGSTGLGLDGPVGALDDTHLEAMTGYVLARDAWGQGYATEALHAMVDLASTLSIERVFAMCHPDNRASIHVLEKCQFSRDDGWFGQTVFPNLGTEKPQDVLFFERFLVDVARR